MFKIFPFQWQGSGGHNIWLRPVGWGAGGLPQSLDDGVRGGQGENWGCASSPQCCLWLDFVGFFSKILWHFSVYNMNKAFCHSRGDQKRPCPKHRLMPPTMYTSSAESSLTETLVGRRTWEALNPNVSGHVVEGTHAKDRLGAARPTLLRSAAATTTASIALVTHTASRHDLGFTRVQTPLQQGVLVVAILVLEI